ncbi:MAG: hypothetical protein MZV70_58375 [Desulfobacterales bacterium]|nr:hypothetical protein [Desulfobacterales bacterium]
MNKIVELKDRYKKVGISSSKMHMNYELIGAWELDSMLDIGHTIVLGRSLTGRKQGCPFKKGFS